MHLTLCIIALWLIVFLTQLSLILTHLNSARLHKMGMRTSILHCLILEWVV